ncbi:MAG: hypothetical protein GY820_01425 [Gammaproteobacteria bacterium]|nr:hypothetical protein [Gammaproteobacteria bacterium]
MHGTPIHPNDQEAHTMTMTFELTGYLGSDPRIRHTSEKTFTLSPSERPHDTHLFCHGPNRPVPDPEVDLPIDTDAEIEITRPPREFVALSVATHHSGQTAWHQLRAWNVDPDHPKSHYFDLLAYASLARAIGSTRLAAWRPGRRPMAASFATSTSRASGSSRPAGTGPAPERLAAGRPRACRFSACRFSACRFSACRFSA